MAMWHVRGADHWVPETAEVQAAAGLAAYRSGDLNKAETCFRKSLKLKDSYAEGLRGLALIYSAVSKFKSARALIVAAYHASPGDPQLITAWANTLHGDEHIAALERALAIYDRGSREARVLRAHIARDQAVGARKLRRLETPYQNYQIKLLPISPGTGQPYGIGMRAQLNKGHTVQLMLDTGSSGISISPKAAEKCGLEILGGESTEARGMGSQKPQEAFDYLARQITIGGLSFADFPVDAFRAAKTPDYDGLIGADVFQRFLVTIDFRGMRLLLETYPEEPDTEGEGADAAASLPPGFFRFLRFGNHITVHTSDVAKESTKVRADSYTALRGIQGRVDKVSRASQVSLVFAGFRQDNSNLLAASLESLGDAGGVGIAGILGMPVLRQMKLTLDYRNGAVRFEHKPR